MIKVLEKKYLRDNYINLKFIHNMNLKNNMKFNKNNIYYFGNYDDKKLEIVKKELIKNKKNIIDAIENKIKFIITGNSINMFNNNFKINELNIFTCYNPNEFKNRFKKLLMLSKNSNIKLINNLNNAIDSNNFRYKNLYCISDVYLIDEIIKKQSS